MIITYVALGVSLALNLVVLILYKKKPQNNKKQLATDARQLLHDLTHGGSVVRISVIDPSGLMIYRGNEQ